MKKCDVVAKPVSPELLGTLLFEDGANISTPFATLPSLINPLSNQVYIAGSTVESPLPQMRLEPT